MARERMSRERRRESSARVDGGWIPVLRRSSMRSPVKSRGANGDLFTLFVDDIPDSTEQTGLSRMFAKFGVVKDAFIPRKRSKLGRRFGFVRYDCVVAAEVAIKQTNGIWVQDKELKVKIADYAQGQAEGSAVKGTVLGRTAGAPHQIKRKGVDQKCHRGRLRGSAITYRLMMPLQLSDFAGSIGFGVRIVWEYILGHEGAIGADLGVAGFRAWASLWAMDIQRGDLAAEQPGFDVVDLMVIRGGGIMLVIALEFQAEEFQLVHLPPFQRGIC
ncbi:Probable RNA-binding protein 19 [Dionaea muscipula]